MTEEQQRIAEALMQNQAATPPPMQYDPAIEAAAMPNQIPMHPMIAALVKKLGLLGMIRNRANESVIDPETGMPMQ